MKDLTEILKSNKEIEKALFKSLKGKRKMDEDEYYFYKQGWFAFAKMVKNILKNPI